MKDAYFREEHLCHWELSLYLSSSLELYWFSWESLWGTFWVWSMVLLAYLSDDSLMWADFQVSDDRDASFREEHLCHWELSLYLSSSLELYWFSWESLWSDFLSMIHGPSSLFIWRLVYVSWFSSIDERCGFSRGTFLSLRTFSLSFLIPRVILILVRKPLEWLFDYDPWSF